MSEKIISSIFLLLSVITLSNSGPISPELQTQKYLKAYKQFATDLLTSDPTYYVDTGNRNLVKASGIAPYSIGHLLALLNHQETWSIPSKTDFPTALRLSNDEITKAFILLQQKLNSEGDRITYMFSNIFTNQNTSTPSGSELGAETSILGMEDWDQGSAATIINAQIALQTFGNIYGDGDLIPYGGWYGLELENSTRGVFLNTLTYSSEWWSQAGKVTNIGRQHFGADTRTVEFLSYNGIMGYYEDDQFLSIGFPFTDPTKTFVLVQPKRNISELTSADLKQMLETSPLGWITKKSTVEFPVMDFSIYGSSSSQFSKMGISSTFCNKDSSEENILQQISQRIHLKVNIDGVTASSATAVDISKNENPSIPYGQSEGSTPEVNDIEYHQGREVNTYESNEVSEEPLRFDQPFFWYLNDRTVGPMFFGSVTSFKNVVDYLSKEEYDLVEGLQTFAHWSCKFSPAH
jgi:hypothetical protein